MSKSGFVDVEGGKLYYEAAGVGPALVLIHAGVADHHQWDTQMEAFAANYHVIRYDTRNYGQTTTEPGATYSNRQDIADLLDYLNIDKAHLLGCSRGGQIATDFALEFPDRVASLILVGAGVGGFPGEESEDEKPYSQKIDELYEAGEYEQLARLEAKLWAVGTRRKLEDGNQDVYEKVRAWVWAGLQRGEDDATVRVLDPPAYGRLDQIKVPTLVIIGDQDTGTTQMLSRGLVERIPGAKHLVMKNAAHLPNMEYPAEFNRIVLEFLDEITTESS